MKQTKEPKAILPNKIPKTLIKECKDKADSKGLSLNEWLQDVLKTEVRP
jgi:predicted HicB family RNase H-like nuclease